MEFKVFNTLLLQDSNHMGIFKPSCLSLVTIKKSSDSNKLEDWGLNSYRKLKPKGYIGKNKNKRRGTLIIVKDKQKKSRKIHRQRRKIIIKIAHV